MSHVPANAGEQWLREEIDALETRLTTIAGGRDSAYEKALMRAYEAMIRDCRQRLTDLQTTPPN